jgi:hypothetical protein
LSRVISIIAKLDNESLLRCVLFLVVVNVVAMKIDGGRARKRIKRHRPFILLLPEGKEICFGCLAVRSRFFSSLIKLPHPGRFNESDV